MLLAGKTAVITGANRGIGKATAEIFARHGANLWLTTRKVDDEFSAFVSDLTKDTKVTVNTVTFDLADENQVKEAGRKIAASDGAVDILINNAGAIETSLFQMTPMDKMKSLFELNFFAPLLLTQFISKKMTRQKSGSIVNISSSAAIEGNEGRTSYASAKAALLTATKVMAKELAAYNIRVNAVAPGLTETELMRKSTREDALEVTLARTCLKRVGRPEEIANSILFLASDLSSYMTGQVLRVDGGM